MGRVLAVVKCANRSSWKIGGEETYKLDMLYSMAHMEG